ncbi:MAG: A/G-specific adenine glycosylase [Thermoguttaceae bacterium]|nr:A/G-specific adenine glycosylase [Thermoguttaceae bacterium]
MSKNEDGKRAKADDARSTGPTGDIPACWRQPEWRQGFRRRLLSWFARQRRDLPWRRTKDPYAIWVSEIMLQQTQTPTVVRYFERFLAAFPTVEALAQADQAEVLRLWEGLGYYRRAVLLHQAAQKIVSDFGGQFPKTVEQLLQLPGIGRYTAGAILSIAFDQRRPILEANTSRLWARLLAYPEPVGSASAQRLLWYMAECILPRRRVGQFNQALMELGSTVCLPRQPRCRECPVSRFCLAFQKGIQENLPRQRPKPAIEFYQEAALIVRHNDRVFLRRIAEGERWAGLWDFPRFTFPPELADQLDHMQSSAPKQAWLFPLSSEQPSTISQDRADSPTGNPLSSCARLPTAWPVRRSRKTASSSALTDTVPPVVEDFLTRQMRADTGILVRPVRQLTTIRYAVTRYRVCMHCYEAEYVGLADQAEKTTKPWEGARLERSGDGLDQAAQSGGGFQWVGLDALEKLPMSSPARKLACFVQTSSVNALKGKASQRRT